ncbi:MAG: alkaline phosphatase family protein [Deltaproteobacteria bacterium]|nr:alkaline phosphatase family protein [Deltaproteobacteria bacterium]
MSPPRQRLLAMLVDGARPDVMSAMADAGELPTFKKHFIDRGGFRPATSVFPTVSGPAHLPLLTGMHPGQANLPGIRWAERPTGLRGNFLFRTRSYMAPFRASKLARDIPDHITTLFDHVPGTADVNTWFVRGCPGRARFTRFSKAAAFVRSLATRDWYSSDLQAENAVLRAWDRGFPSVSSVFPAVDELGHRFGPTTNESYEAYRRFDVILGRIVDALVKRGVYDQTLICITSDHGQTATHTHVDIDDIVAQVYPKTLAYPKLWRHLFNAEAAAMVSGNSLANIYVMGEKSWQHRPDFETPSGRASELLAVLIAHPAVAHVIYRRDEKVYVVANARGNLVIDARTVADDGVVRFQTHGINPLGGTMPERATRDEILRTTFESDHPDGPWQVVEFFQSARAGDIVVCAHPGFDLRSRFEYQPHNGSHGCLDREHMMVPAAVNGRWQGDHLTALDIFPSMLSAMGLPIPEGRSGRVVPIAED